VTPSIGWIGPPTQGSPPLGPGAGSPGDRLEGRPVPARITWRINPHFIYSETSMAFAASKKLEAVIVDASDSTSKQASPRKALSWPEKAFCVNRRKSRHQQTSGVLPGFLHRSACAVMQVAHPHRRGCQSLSRPITRGATNHTRLPQPVRGAREKRPIQRATGGRFQIP